MCDKSMTLNNKFAFHIVWINSTVRVDRNIQVVFFNNQVKDSSRRSLYLSHNSLSIFQLFVISKKKTSLFVSVLSLLFMC